MRRLVSILVLIVSACPIAAADTILRREIGSIVTEGIPDIPADISEQMRQYQNTRAAFLCGWHPSGDGIFVLTRFGQTAQVHLIQKPLAYREQLTFFDEPVAGLSACPDVNASTVLIRKDIGGNENHQIFSYDLKSGKTSMLTDGQSIHTNPIWSDDGQLFAFASTQRNHKDWDIYISSVDTPTRARCLVQTQGLWYPLDVSPDGKKLLIKNRISVNESHIFSCDIKSGDITKIHPAEEPSTKEQALWAANSKDIYFTSNADNEFNSLRFYSHKGQQTINLTSDIPWDITEIAISTDGKMLAFVANENGYSKLYTLNTANNQYKPIANIPSGVISRLSFHPQKHTLGFVVDGPTRPADVYTYDFDNQQLQPWTRSEIGGLNSDNFVEPELIRYDTFDMVDGKRRQIPAIHYKPKTKGPWPVLIFFHGGPESQTRPRFSYRMQYWVNELGISIIAPNIRGSTGYGKEFVNLDNGYLREDSVKDAGALLDWIEKQEDLDASRVGVYGGSYGGYMVLASMIRYPDRIKCGIDMVGISNFVTFLENTKDYRRDRRRVEYGDESDPDMRRFLTEISPTTNADKITGAIFIAQGLNDPRVPASEAEQMVREIRKNGQSVWYMLAKDEGHGFRKKRNANVFYDAITLFLETHLLEQ